MAINKEKSAAQEAYKMKDIAVGKTGDLGFGGATTKQQGIVVVEELHKHFMIGENKIDVLRGIDLEIDQGDFAMLVGPSGCGKSTLLHIIYGLEAPTQGKVYIKGDNIWDHTKNWRADFRNASVGFIPQQAFWLKSLSVLENVAIPSAIGGMKFHHGMKKAAQMLELVGMSQWAKHRPYDLSGGQQQRVALARALLLNPWFIIGDEPTGNLDQRSGERLMDLMKDFNERFNITVLMVTHNPKQYKYATKVFEMLDGKIAGHTKTDRDRTAPTVTANAGQNVQPGKLKPATNEIASRMAQENQIAKAIDENNNPARINDLQLRINNKNIQKIPISDQQKK